MIALTAIVSTLLSAAAPMAVHQETVEHRGSSYDVTYQPHITATSKTVGAHAGTRMNQQACRWTIAVEVDRHIRQPGRGEALTRRLAEQRRFTGDKIGSCPQNRRVIETATAARESDIRAHLRAIASADRPALLAEIDTARSLALN